MESELRANHELSSEDVPEAGADWHAIAVFALTFNGYEHWGSFDRCADVARNASLDSSLTDLRTWLFFEQRRWRHLGEDPDPETMKQIRAFLERVRAKLTAGQLS